MAARRDAIEVNGLRKVFGDAVAVEHVSFSVAAGTVVGLLGPNGAGKTTTIGCLTTLLVPDAGTARVFGYDVLRQPDRVRATIAATGQFTAVDDALTGRENLVMFGRLLRLSRAEAGRRGADLLAQFDLADATDRPVRTYSGGMRRRLDLAISLIVPRPVIFLDEPTTGLDPRSRRTLWDVVLELRSAGTTVLLTTQYLEEADALADGIVVIDHGRVIAAGTPDELKERVGGSVCEIRLATESDGERAVKALRELAGLVEADGVITVPAQGAAVMADVIRRLDAAGVEPSDVALRRPTLDDVFLALTGKSTEAESQHATFGAPA